MIQGYTAFVEYYDGTNYWVKWQLTESDMYKGSQIKHKQHFCFMQVKQTFTPGKVNFGISFPLTEHIIIYENGKPEPRIRGK